VYFASWINSQFNVSSVPLSISEYAGRNTILMRVFLFCAVKLWEVASYDQAVFKSLVRHVLTKCTLLHETENCPHS
jgi:hypothetical protein